MASGPLNLDLIANMHLRKVLKPRGGKFRQFMTCLAYGIIGGTFAGILVGLIWVSVDWMITLRSGSRPALAWVEFIYEVGATMFGFGGAVLGAIVGSAIGISRATNEEG